MDPRVIPSVIASGAAATATTAWCEWDNWNLIWSIVSDDADAWSERTLRDWHPRRGLLGSTTDSVPVLSLTRKEGRCVNSTLLFWYSNAFTQFLEQILQSWRQIIRLVTGLRYNDREHWLPSVSEHAFYTQQISNIMSDAAVSWRIIRGRFQIYPGYSGGKLRQVIYLFNSILSEYY